MLALPTSAGVSLKAEHFKQILNELPPVPWFEIHPENYMVDGGPTHTYLEKICEHYPISMHGVGMSLGSAEKPDKKHLQNLKNLIDRYQPRQVSEHLSWSLWNKTFVNDLLPLPYTHEALDTVSENIDCAQEFIQRQIIIENPSVYLEFDHNELSEIEFLDKLCQRTGCALLLDVNNVYVSTQNLSNESHTAKTNTFSAEDYIDTFPDQHILEVHLAGHTKRPLTEEKTILIDDHGAQVCDEVWALFQRLINKANRALPTLIEWDTALPEFGILHKEAQKAQAMMMQSLGKSE